MKTFPVYIQNFDSKNSTKSSYLLIKVIKFRDSGVSPLFYSLCMSVSEDDSQDEYSTFFKNVLGFKEIKRLFF